MNFIFGNVNMRSYLTAHKSITMHTERNHLTAWKEDFDSNPLSTQLVKHLNLKEDNLQGSSSLSWYQSLLISHAKNWP